MAALTLADPAKWAAPVGAAVIAGLLPQAAILGAHGPGEHQPELCG